MKAGDVIARARSALGTRFVLHGRDPEIGLDCVGLVAFAIDRIALAPIGYALRNSRINEWEALLAAACVAADRDEPGCIHLLQAGPAQLHLGLWTGHSLIHADARTRRVVELPEPVVWPLLSAWKLKDQT